MQLVVGRVGRAHGVSGEVAVSVKTDDPQERFADGSVLVTDPVERGPLRVTRSRWHSGRLLVVFDGVGDRRSAEALAGTALVVDTADLPPLQDPEDFYDHQLVGLAAVTTDGDPIGTVADVIHAPGSDVLAIARPGGAEALVPFVHAIVPSVDLAAGRVVIDPPAGLLDL
ncbi:MAG TPA: ribosome maturation factor RimM [Mycobacteriales bacterium]|nr:ribosome maturation factor RimM [Mycobacteriales bacterium]